MIFSASLTKSSSPSAKQNAAPKVQENILQPSTADDFQMDFNDDFFFGKNLLTFEMHPTQRDIDLKIQVQQQKLIKDPL